MSLPRVLLDVDGIVASFCGAAVKVMSQLSGKPIHHDDIDRWEVTEILESHEMRMAAKAEFNKEGFCQSFELYDGAQEAVQALRHISNVYFVTAPMKDNRSWMPERVEWLMHHFDMPFTRVAFVCDKFMVNGDFLLEDSPTNAENWLAENPHGTALLWDRRYNRNQDGKFIRVSNWDEVIQAVKDWSPERRQGRAFLDKASR